MNIASFGNLFGPDTLIIFLVILILFGAKKLPELAKGMGQAVREFSKAKDDIEREVTRPPTPEPIHQLAEPKVEVAAADSHATDFHTPAATTAEDREPEHHSSRAI
ncbi:MAG TPA: twin-arginine translocase TatA/TatE family subunit [Chthoniobacteraceae bacterium]|jgi:sec-independent protein translocase protein TatA|nr:twin-arginine translocation protein TatA/E family subunit [Chthoniobacter sp.]HEV7868746.1 twin-arginine translocase TatA/TatE family subunit [Chthoniobacteraceae bacterium]